MQTAAHRQCAAIEVNDFPLQRERLGLAEPKGERDRYEPEIICGDVNFAAADPTGLLLAVMSSSMFLTWLATIGGRLESRLRFSSTVVWNNLPMPLLDRAQRDATIAAGESVQSARAAQEGKSLSDLYRPGLMEPALVDAHLRLDAVVDKAFGLVSRDPTEEERQSALFESYAKLDSGLLASGLRTRSRGRIRLAQ